MRIALLDTYMDRETAVVWELIAFDLEEDVVTLRRQDSSKFRLILPIGWFKEKFVELTTATEGPEWHNPEGFSQERLGAPEWRFLVKGEQARLGDQFWSTLDYWEDVNLFLGDDTDLDWTYRTKRPPPQK